MTEQLDIYLPDESDAMCDDPDKCPIAACGCRWLQTGDAWADNNESEA